MMTDHSSTKKAVIAMAELHQILQLKKENHDLTSDDLDWLAFTEPYFKKAEKDIDKDAITFAISMARLAGSEYVSPVNGAPISAKLLWNYRHLLNVEEKAKDKPRWKTVVDELRKFVDK